MRPFRIRIQEIRQRFDQPMPDNQSCTSQSRRNRIPHPFGACIDSKWSSLVPNGSDMQQEKHRQVSLPVCSTYRGPSARGHPKDRTTVLRWISSTTGCFAFVTLDGDWPKLEPDSESFRQNNDLLFPGREPLRNSINGLTERSLRAAWARSDRTRALSAGTSRCAASSPCPAVGECAQPNRSQTLTKAAPRREWIQDR